MELKPLLITDYIAMSRLKPMTCGLGLWMDNMIMLS